MILRKPGTKKNPGLLYGVSGDVWAALALGVTWWDLNSPAEMSAPVRVSA
jgi:hypothetical protein